MFIEAKDDGGGGDNWTTGAISHAKLQSNHHCQQTNIQVFYRLDALPVAQPTVSKHWRECITFHGLAYPKLTWGLPNLSLTTNSSWLPWGRFAMPLISPLMPVPQSLKCKVPYPIPHCYNIAVKVELHQCGSLCHHDCPFQLARTCSFYKIFFIRTER